MAKGDGGDEGEQTYEHSALKAKAEGRRIVVCEGEAGDEPGYADDWSLVLELTEDGRLRVRTLVTFGQPAHSRHLIGRSVDQTLNLSHKSTAKVAKALAENATGTTKSTRRGWRVAGVAGGILPLAIAGAVGALIAWAIANGY